MTIVTCLGINCLYFFIEIKLHEMCLLFFSYCMQSAYLLLLFSHQIISSSLRPHGLQHTRLLFFTFFQSLLKLMPTEEISPEYSLEGLMLKLKLHWFGHLMQRTDSMEKTMMLGKAGREGDGRGWGGWMASLTQWTWVWVSSGGWWWIQKPDVLQSMGSQRVRHDWETELNWIHKKQAQKSFLILLYSTLKSTVV